MKPRTRYLNPKASRWLSGDPAVGEYIPSAPVSDEARKRNGNLPGMGGVFNYVNLHVYHYGGNNPVKLVDPDGEQSGPPLAQQPNFLTINANDLTVRFTIDFSNNKDKFDALKNTEAGNDRRWTFNNETYTATFTF